MSTTTNPVAKNEYFNQYTNFVFAYLQAVRKHTKGSGYTVTLSAPIGTKKLADNEKREYARWDLNIFPEKESGLAIIDLLNAHPALLDFNSRDKPSVSLYFKASDLKPAVFEGKKEGNTYSIPSIKGRLLDLMAVYVGKDEFYKKPSVQAEETPEVIQDASDDAQEAVTEPAQPVETPVDVTPEPAVNPVDLSQLDSSQLAALQAMLSGMPKNPATVAA